MKKLLPLLALFVAAPLAAQTIPERLAVARAQIDAVIEELAHQHPAPPPFKPLTAADVVPLERFELAAWTTAARVPPSAKPDVVGAARFICNMGRLSHDDPIAYPGQPGKAHLHQFFGNTLTDAQSTYDSLRTSGGSTCQGDVLNRSAYWIPALQNGKGSVIVPDNVGLYYKRLPQGECTKQGLRCAGIPAGLRAIFGTNYVLNHLQSPHVRFDCGPDTSITQTIAATVAKCPGLTTLYARINAPDCWNGVDLDSQDHQAHLAYQSRDRNSGQMACPATHPVLIPKLTITVAWTVEAGDSPAAWRFSSDEMANAPGGSTFHADYMEAWEPKARLAWEAACIDRLLNCSDGDLGDGRKMKRPPGFTFAQRPRLVPIP